MVITLGEPETSPDALVFEGGRWIYDNTSTGTGQFIQAGFITANGEKRWYVGNFGGGLDGTAPIATATCHEGTHWKLVTDNPLDPSEGCIGTPGDLMKASGLTITPISIADCDEDCISGPEEPYWTGGDAWVVRFDGKGVATLKPEVGDIPDFQWASSGVTFDK